MLEYFSLFILGIEKPSIPVFPFPGIRRGISGIAIISDIFYVPSLLILVITVDYTDRLFLIVIWDSR